MFTVCFQIYLLIPYFVPMIVHLTFPRKLESFQSYVTTQSQEYCIFIFCNSLWNKWCSFHWSDGKYDNRCNAQWVCYSIIKGATNPYGRTKLFVEEILEDVHVSDKGKLQCNLISLLRLEHYSATLFQSCWSTSYWTHWRRPQRNSKQSHAIHKSRFGEIHKIFTVQFALERENSSKSLEETTQLKMVLVFGITSMLWIWLKDTLLQWSMPLLEVWTDTRNRKLDSKPGCAVYNLGTGNGLSVLDMVHAMEKVFGKKIPFTIVDRRPGDVPVCFANPTKAKEELNWIAELGVDRMCQDSWNWQSKNPNGYLQSWFFV